MGYKLTGMYIRPNGTELQIRPNKWKPGADTLLYLPLNSTDTYTDQSGLNRSLTNTNVAFGTYQGVDCGYFNGYAHIQCNTIFEQPQTLTVACRCYSTGSTRDSYRQGQIYDANDANDVYRYCTAYSIEGRHGYVATLYGPTTYVSNAYNYTNQWILLVTVYSPTEINLYLKNSSNDILDTVPSVGQTITPTYINIGNEFNNAVNRFFIGGLSNLIVESKAWTAQDITNYYNATKSNYGIN